MINGLQRSRADRHHIPDTQRNTELKMPKTFLILLALVAAPVTLPGQAKLAYTLHVDTADLSGIAVELRIPNAPASITLAAHAHPEYDDKYWRHVEAMRVTDAAGRELPVVREDSVLWRVRNQSGNITVRYRVQF